MKVNTIPLRGNITQAVQTWNLSRPIEKRLTSSQICQHDCSALEMVEVICNVTSPIFVRELFATLRETAMWASGSRTEKSIELFTVDPFLLNYKKFEDSAKLARDYIKTSKDLGTAQDQYRMNLPIFSDCTYTIKLNLRSLVRILVWLHEQRKAHEKKDKRAIYDYMINQFYPALYDLIVPCMVAESEFPILVKSIKYAPILEGINMRYTDADRAYANGNSHYLSMIFSGTFSLRTHVIRHREFAIMDSFADKFFDDDFIVESNLSSNIVMSVGGKRSYWDNVISKPFDPSYPIVLKFLDKLGFGLNTNDIEVLLSSP